MPVWGWIVLVVVLLAAAGAVAWALWSKRRSDRLRETFGPEYGRTVETVGDRREAESQLEARRQRRERMQIRSLSPEARDPPLGAFGE